MGTRLQSNGRATEQIGVLIEQFTGGAVLRIERAVEWPRSFYAPSDGDLCVPDGWFGGQDGGANGQSNGCPNVSMQAIRVPPGTPTPPTRSVTLSAPQLPPLSQ